MATESRRPTAISAAAIAAVRAVAAGEELFAPSVLRRLVAAYVREPPDDAADVLAPLTDRERDVLRELATGSTNAEIAAARRGPSGLTSRVARAGAPPWTPRSRCGSTGRRDR